MIALSHRKTQNCVFIGRFQIAVAPNSTTYWKAIVLEETAIRNSGISGDLRKQRFDIRLLPSIGSAAAIALSEESERSGPSAQPLSVKRFPAAVKSPACLLRLESSALAST
jgi:hypothetical protein